MIFIPQLGLISNRRSSPCAKVAYPLTISRPTYERPFSQESSIYSHGIKPPSRLLVKRRNVSRGSTRVSTDNTNSLSPVKTLYSPVSRSTRNPRAYYERIGKYLGDSEHMNLYLLPEVKIQNRFSNLHRPKAASVNHSLY